MQNKLDEILNSLVDLAYSEVNKAKCQDYFSKDLAEACGIVLSLAYERWVNK